MQSGYPIVVNVAGKRCVVVGGGRMAERKIAPLLDAGASVTVISPRATGRIAAWAEQGRLSWTARPYESGDCDGAFLVIAATDRPDINERVYREADARGQLVNVVDRPEWCGFTVPAVYRDGGLTVAVSTSGLSPAVAAKIRDRIGRELQGRYGPFLEFVGEYRKKVLSEIADRLVRERLLNELTSDEALELVREGDWEPHRRRMLEKLREAGAK